MKSVTAITNLFINSLKTPPVASHPAKPAASLESLLPPPPAIARLKPASSGFLDRYGLRENPFADSLNPAFFYRTAAHEDALEKMRLTAEHNISLGLVTGPSGTGKTLVTQLLLTTLDPARHQIVLVLVTPGLSKTGLLREILSELGIAQPAGLFRTEDLVKLLSNAIIDLHEEGRRLVVIIDECHLLSADCLHILRTISNLEIPQCKLATCLLFGEERFLKRLQNASYEALRNRMFFQVELPPMDLADSAQYLKLRLLTAGRMPDLFTAGAVTALHERSLGICRNLNKCAMLTLVEGARIRADLIDEKVVITALRKA